MKEVKGKLIALGGGDDDGLIKLIHSKICSLCVVLLCIAPSQLSFPQPLSIYISIYWYGLHETLVRPQFEI